MEIEKILNKHFANIPMAQSDADKLIEDLDQLINSAKEEYAEKIEKELPENPYPEWLFPMTTKEYVKAIPDGKLRTAISGCVGRWVWNNFIEMTKETIRDSKE